MIEEQKEYLSKDLEGLLRYIHVIKPMWMKNQQIPLYIYIIKLAEKYLSFWLHCLLKQGLSKIGN